MPTQDNSALSAAATKALNDVKDAVKGFASKRDLEELQTKYAALQVQCDAIDSASSQRFHGGNFGKSLETMLGENESIQRLLKDTRGKGFIKFSGAEEMAALYRKSIISATASGSVGGDTALPVGLATSGVLMFDRAAGVTTEARQKLKLEDVLTSSPTEMAVVDFIKISTPMSVASPVPEASVKPENQLNFSSVSEKVRLVAHWLPATRQVLDDLPSLLSIIQNSLIYYLNLEVELLLVAGDGTGENLAGLVPQAAAFNTAVLNPTSGWTMIDILGQAIQQINTSKELDPTFVVLHTVDYWKLRLTKDGFGRYILGSPDSPFPANLFGLNLVYTTSITKGTFLVGSGNPAAAEIKNRMEAVVEVSTEHASFFTSNLIAVRGERRLALLTRRPNSFVTGSFSTSPAS